MQVKELGHLVLYVRDLKRSAAFYGEVLGWEVAFPATLGIPAAAFIVGAHPSRAAAHRGGGGRRTPARAAAIWASTTSGSRSATPTTSCARRWPALEEAGVPIVGASDHTVTHSLYILDPDGNEIELYIDVPGVDWKSDPSLIMAPVKPLAL